MLSIRSLVEHGPLSVRALNPYDTVAMKELIKMVSSGTPAKGPGKRRKCK